jgi:FRG domain-containing protein
MMAAAKPQEIELASYHDLVRLDACFPYDRPSLITFLFRGHARSDWKLVPSLVRQVNSCGLSAVEALAVERAARLEFLRQAHLHLPVALLGERDDAMSWWLTMQHYNAPTRLLDWTRSLFVAAYFAVEREEESDGAIWILHAPRMVHETRQRFGLELPAEPEAIDSLFMDPAAKPALLHVTATAQTDRMIAQQIGFTVSPWILADHGAVLDDLFASSADQFLKAIIPRRSKPAILRQLRQVNITANTLFPGIDGLGRSVAELVRLDCHHVAAAREREGAR